MENWNIIVNQAKKNLAQKTIWTSFVEKRAYCIGTISDTKIGIKRLNGGNDSLITPGAVNTAIEKLRANSFIPRGKLMSSIAKECALIQLHPKVDYTITTGNISWNSKLIVYDDIEQIIPTIPEDELEKVSRLVNLRKYQSLFRRNLLAVYSKACVVSGSSCEEVLEAAHILPHAVSGNNSTINGLLLRADLHILFDRRLMLIHPNNLTIHFSPEITDLEYLKFEGNAIRGRTDKKTPNTGYLKQKWESVDWTSS